MTDLLTGMLGWEAEFVKAFAWRTGGNRAILYEMHPILD